MANGWGGRRPNQTGRPSRPSKRTQLALRAWARKLNPEIEAPLPAILVMRDNMGYWHTQARHEAMQLYQLMDQRATPAELIKLAALYHRARDKSQEVARDLIPYESPRLSQITIKTLDLNAMEDDELNAALISMGTDIDALYAEIITDEKDKV